MSEATVGPAMPTSVQVLRDLIDESRALRADLDRDRAQRRREARLVIVGIMLVFLLLGGLLTLVVQFETDRKSRIEQNSEILRRTESLSKQIADCTTAGGKCYERGTKRTEGAVAQLLRVDIAVAWCTRSADTSAELERCVAQYLATSRPSPAPVPSPTR